MNRILLIILPALFLGGCATRFNNEQARFDNEQAAYPFDMVMARMNGLRDTDAPRSVWNKAVHSFTVIKSVDELHRRLAIYSFPSEIARAQHLRHMDALFRSSHATVKYEFECDFSALVFFDRQGRPIYVRM